MAIADLLRLHELDPAAGPASNEIDMINGNRPSWPEQMRGVAGCHVASNRCHAGYAAGRD